MRSSLLGHPRDAVPDCRGGRSAQVDKVGVGIWRSVEESAGRPTRVLLWEALRLFLSCSFLV